jgi:hypothetical protein
MNRLAQLHSKLGFTSENGLFFLTEVDSWFHKFPYRISRILRDILKPDSFFCLHFSTPSPNLSNHPSPINQSFILFYDNPSDETSNFLFSNIINFGLAQAVFINRNSTLDLYHGDKFLLPHKKELIHIKRSNSVADFADLSFINQLRGIAFKNYNKNRTRGESKLIDRYLLENITDARRILIAKDGLKLPKKVANRLIGRLLFISYLIDRGVTFNDQKIIVGKTKSDRKKRFKEIIPQKDLLYEFFKYLNNKYDGDIFPLNESDYNEEFHVKDKHLEVLYHLFSCSKFFSTGGGDYNDKYSVQQSLFDLYDFEIIPVELISSIYENFIGDSEENKDLELSKQKDIKAYYTPSYIVDFVLSQTLTPFFDAKDKQDSNCRVLDPACGSGIFLVETLRKIIEKELQLTQKKEISDSRLWELVKNNLYGIDIDSDAIDITIFSLYITLLDYKKPPEIEHFKFHKLKNKNFFGGKDSDFFNLRNKFNLLIKDLNFIIGNAPWGIVSQSGYIEYIKNRSLYESKTNPDKVSLRIGDNDICQAFLIRTSDFGDSSLSPICSFIISSKVLYNRNSNSKAFRNYFLQKFHIKQVVELSAVNNKIRGGAHVFDNARQPAAIITFKPAKSNEKTNTNLIQHITIKPNRFFLEYRTLVIEKHDVKNIKQEYFIEKYGGYDWLWKVLVYGNALDIHFIKRLKSKKYKSANTLFKELNYEWSTGIKLKDGDKKYDARPFLNYKYIDAKKDFHQFELNTSCTLKSELITKGYKDWQIGYIPEKKFFEGPKLLIKSGVVLDPDESENIFNAVSVYNEDKFIFSSTVCSIKAPKGSKNAKLILSSLSGLFNSNFFTYYLLLTNSSVGVERSRIHFKESFEFPVIPDIEISKSALALNNNFFIDKTSHKEFIEKRITQLYDVNDIELALIDYTINVSVPSILRDQNIYFKPINIVSNRSDKEFISNYVYIFIKIFNKRFSKLNKVIIPDIIYSNHIIRINFNLISKSNENDITDIKIQYVNDSLLITQDLGFYNVCKDLFIQQDVRGFTDNSFYIIKPNERKLWHKAVGYLDALEFEEELTNAEIRIYQKGNIL